jgi:energy-coupling factor transporter ATP-binding protein EcfA2
MPRLSPRYHAFVSYTSRDWPQVEHIAGALRRAGVNILVDIWHLKHGRPWLSELELALSQCGSCIAVIGPGERGPWQQREIQYALDRQVRDPDFAVIPVLLPGADPSLGFLGLNTWIDLREGLQDESRIRLLGIAVAGQVEEPVDGEAVRAETCPYRGLLNFREEDAPYFFGRGTTTSRVHQVIDRHSFVAVVGASGSGKSSILKAGLLPLLRRNRSVTWDFLNITPTDNPFQALVGAVDHVLRPGVDFIDRRAVVDNVATQMRRGAIAITDLIEELISKQYGTDRVLLVIDQWEEMSTLVEEKSLQREFVAALLCSTEPKRGRPSPLSVVIAVRGDFIGSSLLSHRELADRLDGNMVNVGPMTTAELRSVIIDPAAATGLTFEDGLVGRMLEEVGGAPGNLPLLEFLLRQLWERRKGSVMLHEAFDEVGGLKGALASYADQLLGRLSEEQIRATQSLFTNIVRTGEGVEATSRRTRIADLPEDARSVVSRFADERMVVTSRSLDGSGDVVEIAHEALIQGWETLRHWILEDFKFLLWRDKVRTLLSAWMSSEPRASHRDRGALLRGLLLEESLAWRKSRRSTLSAAELEFIGLSQVARDVDRNAADEQKRRELQNENALLVSEAGRVRQQAIAQDKARHFLIAMAILFAVVVVTMFALIGTIYQVQRAREQYMRTENAELKASRLADAYPAADSARLIMFLSRSTLVDKKPEAIRPDDQKIIAAMMDDYDRTFMFLASSSEDLLTRVDRLIAQGERFMVDGNYAIGLMAFRNALLIAEQAFKESATAPALSRLTTAHVKTGDALAKMGSMVEAREQYASARALLTAIGTSAGRPPELDKTLKSVNAKLAALQ